MLFASVGQGWIFLIIFILGCWCGVFDILIKIISTKISTPKNSQKIHQKSAENSKKISIKNSVKKVKIKNQKINFKEIGSAILYFVKVLIYGALLFVAIYFLDYGNVRFYHIFAFCVGLWLINTLFVRYVQKFPSKCYNYAQEEQNDKIQT